MAVNTEAKRHFTIDDPELLREIGLDPSNLHVLNPEQLVFAYMGRCVPEKAGLDRAFYGGPIEVDGVTLQYGNLEYLAKNGVVCAPIAESPTCPPQAAAGVTTAELQ